MRLILIFSLLLTIVSNAVGLDQIIGEFEMDSRDVAISPAVSWSAARLEREDRFLNDWEKHLESIDYEPLDNVARIDWHLLRNLLRERRNDLFLQRSQLQEIHPLLAFSEPLLELARGLGDRQLADSAESASALTQASVGLKELRKQLDAGRAKDAPADSLRPTPGLALRAVAAIDELRDKIDGWYKFYDGFQPDFRWWNEQPYRKLLSDLDALTSFLKKDIAAQKGEPDDPLVGDPIGAASLRSSLDAQMIPYSTEELIAIAEKEFAWCEAEMKKAATDLGCQTTAEALEKVKSHHIPAGGQAAQTLEIASKAIRFLKERDLVTIPPLAEESWGISMLSPQAQKSLPYAVYGQPRIMVAYAHEAMDHVDKLEAMRGNAYAFLHIVTPHELIPGHHLQAFMGRRHSGYRSPFRTPFLIEGWALHWEMLLWDQGYTATPEEKVGALFWRMHRCARVIVSLKFHLGQMNTSEMIDFLVEKVGHERSAATAEVRRYVGPAYGPLYQAAYMIGGLQLHALQKELTGPGSKEAITLRQFHDRILTQGPIPIQMIRAALKNESLPKSWKPDWRFAD
ncbi:DUF885 family protein [Luteolibacter yonseiensis]|uniref:DUF885 family protein n=1 Tax=Luteolibacter yonseiensis TaxID=1144680 RepID=A0A934R234_9BACT|nr:DUF885 family protein [Luteolibacter yonseiensis]MBK1814876.1 DUF885 family protein [Luteolibacter yonseiensis]